MSKHSPGPYRIEFVESFDWGYRIFDANNNEILRQHAACHSSRQKSRQDNLDAVGFDYGEDQNAAIEAIAMQNANGELFAMSFELLAQRDMLLEALVAAMKFIDSHVADPDITDEMTKAWAELQKIKPYEAIARAKGGA